MTAQVGIIIREFAAGDAEAFRKLNEEWIQHYFELEGPDREVLNDPKGAILDRGGRIFVAERNGELVGCCALLAAHEGEYEVAKMAVSPECRGTGIGRRVLEFAIAAARESGATRLTLETNRKLAVAIGLYESVGFQHVPASRVPPSPYARCDVAMEMFLSK